MQPIIINSTNFFFFQGWHRGFQQKLQGAKRRPHDFVEVLMDENLIREQRYYRLRSGHETAPPMRPKQRQRISRIKAIVQDCENRDPIAYLEDLSYSVKLDDGRFD